MTLEFVSGSEDLPPESVAHILIPGRGRLGGASLTESARDRVAAAAALYLSGFLPPDGRIVCSGYRSPADDHGVPWSPEGSDERFLGVPEADLMAAELTRLGVPRKDIHVERHSIDTVTNLALSECEGHFGDHRPVAIVAQRAHLNRILHYIAPRLLERRYLGVVVPEPKEAKEGPWVTLATRLILARLPASPREAAAASQRRAELLWRLILALGAGRSYHSG
jgi:DUF218 domain-containing protein